MSTNLQRNPARGVCPSEQAQFTDTKLDLRRLEITPDRHAKTSGNPQDPVLSSGHNSPAQCQQPSASRRKLPHSRVPILQMPRLTDGSSFKLPWHHQGLCPVGLCPVLVLGPFPAKTTRHLSCYADFLPWNPCKCTSEAPRSHLPPTDAVGSCQAGDTLSARSPRRGVGPMLGDPGPWR